ncbi:conserved phage C-terminal domain-containing protein [Rummeliibacillus pycnus]|uniref:conserved phage C-terminal domain-containing protein n=1 Tax=Rummeliibacillus pycnus TaxID=101070 RepID=UPI0037CC7574
MKLIINQTPLLVIPDLAVMLGINEAMILQQLHYRLNGSPLKDDGHTWYQHTYESWVKQFPFLSVTTIKRTFLKLEKMNYIISTKKFNSTKYDQRKWYRINYDLLYHELEVQIDSSNISKETASTDQMKLFTEIEMAPYLKEEKKKKKEITAAVINYLNKKAGKKFKVTAQHERIIQARIIEGNYLEDFQKVIDHKVKQWKNDPKMKYYLRPSTLFRPTNFENYLNEQGTQTNQPISHYKPIELNLNAGEE